MRISPQTEENLAGLAVFTLVVFIAIGALFGAGAIWGRFRVWNAEMAGKAAYAEAESTRRVAVLEAQAKKDSAVALAEAEVERAKGVAKANAIIGSSLKQNEEYLQWLYINGLEEGSKNGNVTIYVPTENGLPVPTMSYDRK